MPKLGRFRRRTCRSDIIYAFDVNFANEITTIKAVDFV